MVHGMSDSPFNTFSSFGPIGPEHLSQQTLVAGPVPPRNHDDVLCPHCLHGWGYHVDAGRDRERIPALPFERGCVAHQECRCQARRIVGAELSDQVVSWYSLMTLRPLTSETVETEPAPPPVLTELMITSHDVDAAATRLGELESEVAYLRQSMADRLAVLHKYRQQRDEARAELERRRPEPPTVYYAKHRTEETHDRQSVLDELAYTVSHVQLLLHRLGALSHSYEL